jgi:hypothetical protein
MKHWKAWAVLLLVLAGLPAGASAQWAYTAKDVNLRAGRRGTFRWSPDCRGASRSRWPVV